MIYAFGEFELDTRVYELRSGGSVRPVEPQVFDILAYLVANRDRVVSKEEMLDKLWPDRFVSESTLTSRVKEARKAVDDDGSNQSVIRTQRGRGYRFVATVEERGDPGAPETLGSVAPESEDDIHPASSSQSAIPTEPPWQLGKTAKRRGVVGRKTELATLSRHLERALAGERQIVFVTGEAGAGKTTLVETFLADAPPESPILIARGQCVEYRGSGEPYMPLLDAFARLAHGPRGDQLLSTLKRDAPSWAVQMPSVLSDDELGVLRESSGASGERMVRELGMLIDRLTAKTPLLLLLEDLHWSDYATLDAIDLLARQPNPARLLIIGTWRPSDVKAARHPIHALTQELRVKDQCALIRVPLFDSADLRSYLDTRFPEADFLDVLAPVLRERTGGNALFVRNLLDSWIDRDLIRQEEEEWRLETGVETLERDVPDSLQQLMENQISELDPDQQRIVECASVIGRTFPVGLLAAALPAADEDLERECERLARESNIIRSEGTRHWGDGSLTSEFSFVHDLYVDVLYDRIPAIRRTKLHHQIGRALERAWEGREAEHAPELALHFQRAFDRSKGPRYLQLAAEHALERNAYREAVDHLSAALEMLDGAPESNERDAVELQIRCRLAPSLVATRGWSDSGAEENYLRARELAEDLGEAALLSQTLYGLANLYEYRGEFDLSERITRERVSLDESGVAARQLESHELLTCSLLHQGRYEESVRHGEQALEAHSGVDTDELDQNEVVLIVQAHGWMSASLHFSGRTDDAIRHNGEALRLSDDSGNELARASANIQAAFLRFYRREPEECARLAETGESISREFRFPFHVACARILLGWASAVGGGNKHDAIREIQCGIRISEAVGARMDLPVFFGALGEVKLAAGDPEGALAAVDAGIEILKRGRTFFYAPELQRQRGGILLELGRNVEGCEGLELAFEMAESQGCTLFALRAAGDLTRLCGEPWKTRLSTIYETFRQGLETHDLQAAAALLG